MGVSEATEWRERRGRRERDQHGETEQRTSPVSYHPGQSSRSVIPVSFIPVSFIPVSFIPISYHAVSYHPGQVSSGQLSRMLTLRFRIDDPLHTIL